MIELDGSLVIAMLRFCGYEREAQCIGARRRPQRLTTVSTLLSDKR